MRYLVLVLFIAPLHADMVYCAAFFRDSSGAVSPGTCSQSGTPQGSRVIAYQDPGMPDRLEVEISNWLSVESAAPAGSTVSLFASQVVSASDEITITGGSGDGLLIPLGNPQFFGEPGCSLEVPGCAITVASDFLPPPGQPPLAIPFTFGTPLLFTAYSEVDIWDYSFSRNEVSATNGEDLFAEFRVVAVPEPSSLWLSLAAVITAVIARARHSRNHPTTSESGTSPN